MFSEKIIIVKIEIHLFEVMTRVSIIIFKNFYKVKLILFFIYFEFHVFSYKLKFIGFESNVLYILPDLGMLLNV